jgi:hypothetical protein
LRCISFGNEIRHDEREGKGRDGKGREGEARGLVPLFRF